MRDAKNGSESIRQEWQKRLEPLSIMMSSTSHNKIVTARNVMLLAVLFIYICGFNPDGWKTATIFNLDKQRLPNLYTLLRCNVHWVRWLDTEGIVPHVDEWKCTIYTPLAK